MNYQDANKLYEKFKQKAHEIGVVDEFTPPKIFRTNNKLTKTSTFWLKNSDIISFIFQYDNKNDSTIMVALSINDTIIKSSDVKYIDATLNLM